MFDYDLFPYTASTISPYYRQSLFRNFLDFSNSGMSEVKTPNSYSISAIKLFKDTERVELELEFSLKGIRRICQFVMIQCILFVLVFVLQVRSDRDKFTIYLDVKHFSPDELCVKVTDDYVEIQGKHGERQVTIHTLLSK